MLIALRVFALYLVLGCRSCVKLTYLLSAMHWCEAQGKRYDCLDEHVRPMISISSNFETGVIVDIITKGAVCGVCGSECAGWTEQLHVRAACSAQL